MIIENTKLEGVLRVTPPTNFEDFRGNYTEIYNDRYLKRYLTALIKRQWGSNMSKFDGVALPGGVTMRGSQIYAEAVAELQAVEEEILRNYELPVDFMTG